ncbi:MAG TPA: cytochrome b [Nevskiaceae bacterium]|nr:cytochrome b [Nevskiaceae bacterium]
MENPPATDRGARYTRTAMALHWLIFLVLIGSFTIGIYMGDLHLSPTKLKLVAWHKWLGVTVFFLVCLRLGWRLRHTPPALPAGMRAWEQQAAQIGHRLLYLMLFVTPLTGWLMSSAKGVQTVWFTVLPLPDLLQKNPPLGKALEEVHDTLAWMFLGLIALHVAAAFKHLLLDRDEVMSHMVPGLPPPEKKS